jgi:DNA-binding NarL/FixJ family response regulator
MMLESRCLSISAILECQANFVHLAPGNRSHWHEAPVELVTAMVVRILLVDDHPVVRQGLKTLLEARPEWEIVGEASDGVEALEKVAALQPDVVVLDVTMPRMNGIEACRLIQQKAPKREVLFVTQHDSPQMMREALAAGARGYVVKSNLARDLVEAVEAVSQHKEFTALARNPPVQS